MSKDARHAETISNDVFYSTHPLSENCLTFLTIMRWPKILRRRRCVSLFAWEWPHVAHHIPHRKNAES